jgi:hypothetical protein
MDLSNFRRGMSGFSSRNAARPDYRIMVATLEALQSASQTARTLRASGSGAQAPARHDCLVALLLGEPGWRDAVVGQGGCFNRDGAAAAASLRKDK